MYLDIFENFMGTWEIERKIVCKIRALEYNGLGVAKFTPLKNNQKSIAYSENILFHSDSGGKLFESTQEYRYKLDEAQSKIIKYFKDERLFYRLDLDPTGQSARGFHKCGQDLYKARYLLGQDSFSLEYVVYGPSKNYISTTKSTKIL